jgi:hypothetical protein
VAQILKGPVQTAAAQIRDEHTDRANTAQRVGAELLTLANASMFGIDVSSYGAAPSASAATNDAAIAAAISDAMSAGAAVWWPAGTYVVSANIANLHSVRHHGPGVIQRGGDTFPVQPKSSSLNQVYISASGSASNDGLTSALPTTLAQACGVVLPNYGPVLAGDWRVLFAAGTYTGHDIQHITPSYQRVWFRGPSVGGTPNVPTAIIDGTGAPAAAIGLVIRGSGVLVYVTDLKFKNYNFGDNLGIGMIADYGATLGSDNIHSDNCDFAGIYHFDGQSSRINGGIHNNCRAGVWTNATQGTISNAKFTNCYFAGAIRSENSVGHCDNCTFEDCNRGIYATKVSRVHINGCNFKRSTVAAVVADMLGVFYDNSNTYNEGTADANAVKWLNYAFCGEGETHLSSSFAERRVALDVSTHNLTGTTSKTVVASAVYTIPAYWLEDTSKKVRVRVHGNLPAGTPAGCSVGVDFGATQVDLSVVAGAPPASAGFIYECEVWATAANAQYRSANLEASTVATRTGNAGTSVTTSAALAVNITAQLVNAGDTLAVELIEVWVTG